MADDSDLPEDRFNALLGRALRREDRDRLAKVRTALGIRTSRLTVIRGASHFAHYEQPGPVTDALLTHFTATAG